jgi:nicotinate phosphoribosyltransferase
VVYDIERGTTAAGEDLLVPVFRKGEAVYAPPPASEARARAAAQLAALDPAVRRIERPEAHALRFETGPEA